MEISSQAASYSALTLTQNLGGADVVTATRSASTSEAGNVASASRDQSNRNTAAQLSQEQRQAALDRPATKTEAYTNFIYEGAQSIMNVLGRHEVLIYQLPPKGRLEVVNAIERQQFLEATA